jgi:hypothetical protein
MLRPLAFFCLFIWFNGPALAQIRKGRLATALLKEVRLFTDTSQYAWPRQAVAFQGNKTLAFRYSQPQAVAELRLYPARAEGIERLRLAPSPDFAQLDTLAWVNEEFYRVKVRFTDLARSQFLAFQFLADYLDPDTNELREGVQALPLLPYQVPQVRLHTADNELYIGEESVYELQTNAPGLLRADNVWVGGQTIDYKLSERNGQVRLHVLPQQLGSQKVTVRLQSRQPVPDAQGQPTYDLPPLEYFFTVKPSRLAFLKIDREDILLDDAQGAGLEITLAHHRNLQIRKTYRIENQEEPGGQLIGELFTKSKLSNDKVLATIRLYATHRLGDGYLYLKNGDLAEFVTNIGIVPRTSITRVSLSRDGAEWSDNLAVYPGDSLDLRVEGKSLDKADFYFEGLPTVRPDPVLQGEGLRAYRLYIPPDFARRRIGLFNRNANTGYALTVREYQRPRALDFVKVNYGAGDLPLTDLKQSILYDKTINDVVFTFDPDGIDDATEFYGKQYLELEVRITTLSGQLLEFRKIDNWCACPGARSPRQTFYDRRDCSPATWQLNSVLGRKTRDLDDWARIEVTVRHRPDRYGGATETAKLELYLKKQVSFDIDVSFPGGLIVKRIGEKDFSGLGGISLAVVAQFRFFQPNKVASLRPYRFGAGFIALNAFNFDPNNTNRDVGVVAIGSLYPILRNRKLSFPLHAGFGYLLQGEKWFFLIGPGVSVQL